MLEDDNQEYNTFFLDLLAKWGTMHSSKVQNSGQGFMSYSTCIYLVLCLSLHTWLDSPIKIHRTCEHLQEKWHVLLQYPKLKILNIKQLYSLRKSETHWVYIHCYASIKVITAWPHWSHCCPSPSQIYFMVPSSSWCKSEKL